MTNSIKSIDTTSDTRLVWKASERIIQQRSLSISAYLFHLSDGYGTSCLQILTPGPSDVGCPYRHFSPDNLQTALLSMYSQQGLKSSDLPEIMAIVKAGHYHVACTRVFEMTHTSGGVTKGEGIGGGESVTHPNQYAARSMELAKSKNEDEKITD